MSTIKTYIYGKEYHLACDDGQEAHLGKLAQLLADRVRTIGQQAGRIPENLALVMAAITFVDELHDCRRDLEKAKAELAQFSAAEQGDGTSPLARAESMENELSQTYDMLAKRMETLAQLLEAA